MKRAISFSFVFLVFLMIPIICMADNTVNVEEYGFTITFPDETYVFTQETDSSSSVWDYVPINPEAMIDYLKSNGIYLDAIPADGSYEIVMVLKDDPKYQEIFNLNLLKDNEIMRDYSELNSAAEELGMKIEQQRIYTYEQNKFFTYLAQVETDTYPVYLRSYLTIVNGKSIQITLRDYYDPIDSQQEEMIKNVIKSIHFKEIITKPYSASSSASGSSIVSTALYKGLIGGIVALIVSVPYAIIQSAKKKKKNSKDETAENIIKQNQSDSLPKEEHEQITAVIEEEKQRREKADYDEIIYAQRRRKVGQMMLSYGKDSVEVKDRAKQLDMTTDDFLTLCQKWVNEYDDLHRKYNETHSKTVEYPRE